MLKNSLLFTQIQFSFDFWSNIFLHNELFRPISFFQQQLVANFHERHCFPVDPFINIV